MRVKGIRLWSTVWKESQEVYCPRTPKSTQRYCCIMIMTFLYSTGRNVPGTTARWQHTMKALMEHLNYFQMERPGNVLRCPRYLWCSHNYDIVAHGMPYMVSKGLETLINIRNSIDLGQKVNLIDRSNWPLTSGRNWIFVIEHNIWWCHMFCRTLRVWWRSSVVFGSQFEYRH